MLEKLLCEEVKKNKCRETRPFKNEDLTAQVLSTQAALGRSEEVLPIDHPTLGPHVPLEDEYSGRAGEANI